jgi:CRP/FNR family cyclic AMP-dependent transcriptional regulator
MPNNQELLASVPLFSSLGREALDRLDRISVERTYEAGTKIVGEGEIGTGFYLVKSGSVEVVTETGGARLATLTRGQFFGDMALLDGRPRSTTVRALEPTTCLIMTRWDFLAELKSNPDVAVEMLEVLSGRIRALDATVETLNARIRELESQLSAAAGARTNT